MKIEVEIGTIEIDALPSGVTVAGLRAAVAGALEAQIRGTEVERAKLRGNGLGGTGVKKQGSGSRRSFEELRIADEIGKTIQGVFTGEAFTPTCLSKAPHYWLVGQVSP